MGGDFFEVFSSPQRHGGAPSYTEENSMCVNMDYGESCLLYNMPVVNGEHWPAWRQAGADARYFLPQRRRGAGVGETRSPQGVQ